jgi:ribulose-5-phosphate 4-epimerase/fuculose-1-phosphate aldolase
MTQTAADNPLPYRPGERQIRVELAACYRLLARFGFSDLAGAHVSAKIPGTPHYLLNAYGYLFEDVTASSLLAVDLDGKVIGEAGLELNPAGTAIHGAVHRARPDAAAVAHCHPRAVIALSALGCELLPVDQAAIGFHGDVGFADFSFLETAEELGRLVAELGGKHALILRNHGVLTLGRSIPEAWYRVYKLDMVCDVQLRAMAAAAGRPLKVPPAAVCDDAAQRWDTPEYARKAWEALTRRLDAEDASYRL